jgi:hypothetical protein
MPLGMSISLLVIIDNIRDYENWKGKEGVCIKRMGWFQRTSEAKKG